MPSSNQRTLSKPAGLGEILDRLLDRGAVVAGDCTISLAEVDLVYVKLALLLSSVGTLENRGLAPTPSLPQPSPAPQRQVAAQGRGSSEASPERSPSPVGKDVAEGPQATAIPSVSAPSSISDAPSDPVPQAPQDASRSIAQLVLSLVELLRQLMERQASRRMEGGALSDEQIERVGLALQDLETKMIELREIFGLTEEDINIDLGPLGRLS